MKKLDNRICIRLEDVHLDMITRIKEALDDNLNQSELVRLLIESIYQKVK